MKAWMCINDHLFYRDELRGLERRGKVYICPECGEDLDVYDSRERDDPYLPNNTPNPDHPWFRQKR